MKALGLIETKGIIASIECADVMLKTANVSLVEKTKIGGGFVTISILGDVSAVKASVDAGVLAVKQLGCGLLISSHVIPRPQEDINDIFYNISKKCTDVSEQKEKPENNNYEKNIRENENTEDTIDIAENIVEDEKISNIAENIVEDKKISNNTENIVEKNDINIVEKNIYKNNEISTTIHIDLLKLKKDDIDEMVKTLSIDDILKNISKAKIAKLKNLIKEYKEIKMVGKKVDKKSILAEIKKYYENKERAMDR